MRNIKTVVKMIGNFLFPWPAPDERIQAVEDARRQRERAEERRQHALALKKEIEKMRRDNHFAEAIASQLRGHNGGQQYNS